jgi:hypothetical protein
MTILLNLGNMSAKCSFSFRNDRILQTEVHEGICLRLERVGFAVARVYFVNEGFGEVDIPEGFVIVDHANGDAVVRPFPGLQMFVLGWADNYSLYFKNDLVIRLNNQRQWAVQGNADRVITMVDL